jgi:glycogen(starch) synthase
VDIHLITSGGAGAPHFEQINGVKVHRVEPYRVSSPDFVTWVAQFNVALLEKAIPLMASNGIKAVMLVMIVIIHNEQIFP